MQFFSGHQEEKLDVAQRSTCPKYSTTETMKAITYQGKSLTSKSRVAFEDTPKPLITHEEDVIVKVELSSISGCDLNVYSGELANCEKGMIPGHEAVGWIDEVGAKVHKLQKGDRVVVSFSLACGKCVYCAKEQFSECNATNDSKKFADMFGGRGPAAILGHSCLLGGVPGCQAEYVRVPFGDVNCYKVPTELASDKAIFASDVLCTALHATELGDVKEGDTVAIWGLGAVGLFAGLWCQLKKAKRVIGIDHIPERLTLAKLKFGLEVFDRAGLTSELMMERLGAMLPMAHSAGGFDVSIEAAGYRHAQTKPSTMERTLGGGSESSDILTEMARTTRKFGRVVIVGDYVGDVDHFPLGHFIQKHLALRSGFTPCQRYLKAVMEALTSGRIDPTIGITHRLALQNAPVAYEKLFNMEDGYVKVILQNNVP